MTQKEFRVWTLGTGGVVVVMLAIFALTIWTSNAAAQSKNIEVANAAVAKVEAKAKEIDAGVAEQIKAIDKKFSAKFDRQEALLRCTVDKKWCPAARVLLSGDDEP